MNKMRHKMLKVILNVRMAVGLVLRFVKGLLVTTVRTYTSLSALLLVVERM